MLKKNETVNADGMSGFIEHKNEIFDEDNVLIKSDTLFFIDINKEKIVFYFLGGNYEIDRCELENFLEKLKAI